MKGFIIILSLTLASIGLQAQTINKKGKKYFVGDNIYRSFELRPLMENNFQALEMYDKYLRGRKIEDRNIYLGPAIILVGVGIAGIIVSDLSSEPGPELGAAFLSAILGTFIGSMFTLHAIIRRSKSSLRKSIDIYNNDINGLSTYHDKLSFGVTSAGIGLSYTF